MIFNIKELNSLLTKKYFLTVSKENSRYRRNTRKYKRYVEKYFDKYAWPSYEFYKERTFRCFEDLVILNGDLKPSINVNKIINEYVIMVKRI